MKNQPENFLPLHDEASFKEWIKELKEGIAQEIATYPDSYELNLLSAAIKNVEEALPYQKNIKSLDLQQQARICADALLLETLLSETFPEKEDDEDFDFDDEGLSFDEDEDL